MFEDIKSHIKDWSDEEEISAYLYKLLHKEAFDRSGLIYGMGHAVYSVSDPRAKTMASFVEGLSQEKGRTAEYQLYQRVERLAVEAITKDRKIYKGVSANVDFYSGFIYSMLDLPMELYTPIFAISALPAGAPTALRNSPAAEKSSVPLTKACRSTGLLRNKGQNKGDSL